MRAHAQLFDRGEQVFDLAHTLRPNDEINIAQALSGGCGKGCVENA